MFHHNLDSLKQETLQGHVIAENELRVKEIESTLEPEKTENHSATSSWPRWEERPFGR